jgi:hypothetical protein
MVLKLYFLFSVSTILEEILISVGGDGASEQVFGSIRHCFQHILFSVPLHLVELVDMNYRGIALPSSIRF